MTETGLDTDERRLIHAESPGGVLALSLSQERFKQKSGKYLFFKRQITKIIKLGQLR